MIFFWGKKKKKKKKKKKTNSELEKKILKKFCNAIGKLVLVSYKKSLLGMGILISRPF